MESFKFLHWVVIGSSSHKQSVASQDRIRAEKFKPRKTNEANTIPPPGLFLFSLFHPQEGGDK